MTQRRVWLIALLFVGLIRPANASNTRAQWMNRLKQLGLAIQNYESVFGHLPHDLAAVPGKAVDPRAKPHLSWRVGILPFAEYDNLYREFDFASPWDAPRNKDLLKNVHFYGNFFYSGFAGDLAGVVRPLGPCTFWEDGGRRRLKDMKGDPARTILLIEVAENAAPFWTEPRDLQFDPAQPKKGLGWHWRSGFLHERGCFALFGDGTVGMISENLDDESLRRLFAGESVESLTLNWLDAMTQQPIGWLIGPSIVVGLASGLACLAIGYRMWKGRFVSPSELLMFILGAHYLVFVPLFCIFYEYPLIAWGNPNQRQIFLWFLPRVAGCTACWLAAINCRDNNAWRCLFVGLLVVMSISTLDSAIPHQGRRPDESLVATPAPFVLMLAAIIAGLLTWHQRTTDKSPRRLAPWISIAVCCWPLFWFSVWHFSGYVDPRPWFDRILY